MSRCKIYMDTEMQRNEERNCNVHGYVRVLMFSRTQSCVWMFSEICVGSFVARGLKNLFKLRLFGENTNAVQNCFLCASIVVHYGHILSISILSAFLWWIQILEGKCFMNIIWKWIISPDSVFHESLNMSPIKHVQLCAGEGVRAGGGVGGLTPTYICCTYEHAFFMDCVLCLLIHLIWSVNNGLFSKSNSK